MLTRLADDEVAAEASAPPLLVARGPPREVRVDGTAGREGQLRQPRLGRACCRARACCSNSFLRRVSSTDFAAKPGIVPRCKQPVEPRGCYEVLMWSEKVAKKAGATARRVLLV